jgi:hypothetical protein
VGGDHDQVRVFQTGSPKNCAASILIPDCDDFRAEAMLGGYLRSQLLLNGPPAGKQAKPGTLDRILIHIGSGGGIVHVQECERRIEMAGQVNGSVDCPGSQSPVCGI